MPDALAETLNDIEELSEYLAQRARFHGGKGVVARSSEDEAAMILTFRMIKFLRSYLLVARAGYREPAGTLVRAIYETFLWGRWSIIGNADAYLMTGKRKAFEIAKMLKVHGALSPEGDKILEQSFDKVSQWKELAKECDMEVMHDYLYPHLSNLSHGNMYGAVDVQNMRVTFEPDFCHVDKEAAVALLIARNHAVLVEAWWEKQEKAAAPRWQPAD